MILEMTSEGNAILAHLRSGQALTDSRHCRSDRPLPSLKSAFPSRTSFWPVRNIRYGLPDDVGAWRGIAGSSLTVAAVPTA